MVEKVKKKRTNYVNKDDFCESLRLYKIDLESQPEKRIPKYIGECLSAICVNLSRRPNFSGYSYKDEMIGDAIETCLKAVLGFDSEKSKNPFGYFSRVAWNAFVQRILKEQKQTYLKHKTMQMMFTEFADISMGDTGGMVMNEKGDEDISNNIIDNFEKKLTKNKKKGIIGLNKFIEDNMTNDD